MIDSVLRENAKLVMYRRALAKLISDKKLIKKLIKYMDNSSLTTPEKDWIIRAVKRTKIGDKVTAKEIIKRSRNLPARVKKVMWVEPEEDWEK